MLALERHLEQLDAMARVLEHERPRRGLDVQRPRRSARDHLLEAEGGARLPFLIVHLHLRRPQQDLVDRRSGIDRGRGVAVGELPGDDIVDRLTEFAVGRDIGGKLDLDDEAKRTGERASGVFLDSGERAAERASE